MIGLCLNAFNGGGITPDYLLEWMQRKPLYYYHFRGGDDIATPDREFDAHVRVEWCPVTHGEMIAVDVFDSSTDVVEWTKGTSLTRFFKLLPHELHEPFVDAYREELIARIGLQQPYFYAFKRILMWGRLTAPVTRA